MELELIKMIAVNGSYAILFAWLLFNTMKKNDERELRYQKIIDNLTEKIGAIETVTSDIKTIKTDIEIIKSKQ